MAPVRYMNFIIGDWTHAIKPLLKIRMQLQIEFGPILCLGYCKFYYRRRYKQVETCHEKARKSFVQILSFGGELYMSLLYFHPLTTLHCNSLVQVKVSY